MDAVDIFMQQQLELAAYKAMAALCKGRLIVKDKRMSRVMDHEDSSFTFGRMFDWVNSLFKVTTESLSIDPYNATSH